MTKRKPPAKKAAPKKSRARTPPHPSIPEWSTSKYWSFIRSGLRSTYNKWPNKWAVLNEAKRAYTGQGKQQKWEYKCNECGKYTKAKDVSVDHIHPAGALNSYADLPQFVENLFCPVENLQVLCRVCHDRKTAEERQKKELK